MSSFQTNQTKIKQVTSFDPVNATPMDMEAMECRGKQKVELAPR